MDRFPPGIVLTWSAHIDLKHFDMTWATEQTDEHLNIDMFETQAGFSLFPRAGCGECIDRVKISFAYRLICTLREGMERRMKKRRRGKGGGGGSSSS